MGKVTTKNTVPEPQTPASTMGASDLERIVIISGPQAALPKQCQQRTVNTGILYRPVVDTHEGVERLYAKYNLPLFEIIGESCAKTEDISTQQDDKGPVGAVLRRRRSKQQLNRVGGIGVKTAAGKNMNGGSSLEDISDEHYQKLHRKPEYIEKRVRNREIELYQYARWQEGQRKESERRRQQLSRYTQGYTHHASDSVGTIGSDAGTQASSRCASPHHIHHAESSRDKLEASIIEESAETHITVNGAGPRSRKRAKPAIGMRKDIAAPRTKNSPRTRAASPAPSSGSNSQGSACADISTGNVAEPHVPDEGANKAGMSGTELQMVLTDAERKTAHLAGNVLEQLLVQAARLPMQTMPSSPPLSRSASPDESLESESESGESGSGDNSSDEEEEEEETEDGENESQSDGESSSSSSASEDEPADCNGCRSCCPREFALPPRFISYIIKQRKTEENERKRKAEENGRKRKTKAKPKK